MSVKGLSTKSDEFAFAEFWDNFYLLPWKWTNLLTSRSRYLIASVLFSYAALAYMTFFPHNGWIAPISDPWLIRRIGSEHILVLKHYPSIHLVFLGWMLVLSLSIRWRYKIPSIFQWLFNAGRLESQDGNLKSEFQQYLRDYQKALLSKKGPLFLGLVLLFLMLVLGVSAGIPRFVPEFFTPMAVVVIYIVLLISLFWFFLIGLWSWALFITSRQIKKLTQKFEIRIQQSHPDKCGGLKPIGDFCFDTAVPLIGGGLVLAIIASLKLDIDLVMSSMATICLFILVGPLTVITVFMPLWDIHCEMVERKKVYEDAFASQMTGLEQAVYTHTGKEGKLDEAKIAREKLEIFQAVHPDKVGYPVWPFRLTSTVLKIFSPQILATVIGLILSIYETFFK